MRRASLLRHTLAATLLAAGLAGSALAANPAFRISIDSDAWRKFEFRYPATYVFALRDAPQKVEVRRRDAAGDTWAPLAVKTREEFWNGVECVRFDRDARRAYVSVGFHTTPTIDLEFLGADQAEFVEVAKNYDGRKTAYSLSLDNWGCKTVAHPGAPWKGPADDESDNYQAALHVCREFHLPVSIAVNSGLFGGDALWQTMQAELDRRDQSWEPAVHARTHPCNPAAYGVHGYQVEILGCRDEILRRLHDVPFGQHAFEHILTCGYQDETILQTDRGQFVFVRGFNSHDNPTSVDYASWNEQYGFYGVGGLSYKSYDAVFQRRNPAGRYQAKDVEELNAAFDQLHATGGVLHVMWHPDRYRNSVIHDPRPGVDGQEGSSLMQHLAHAANRKDVWYGANGWLYCYRYVAEHADVRPLTTAMLGTGGAAAEPVDADLLLCGGQVHDGSGGEPAVGDVAVRDGRIVAVGKLTSGKIGRTIDCRGLVVAPGLIDLHTHSNSRLGDPANRPCLNYLLQGCTTMVGGNCGLGVADVAKYLGEIDAKGAGTNIIHLVPHGPVRKAAMGSERRAPTAEELQRMKTAVDKAMRDGAWGMSTGLIYPPSAYAKTEELVELAKVVAGHGGIYVSHIRNEGNSLIESIDEAIRIGKESGAAVHISHFKASGIPNWGRIRDAAARIEQARGEGLKVTADQYPYTASSTGLVTTVLPDDEIPEGRHDLSPRMARDPELAALVRRLIARQLQRSKKIVIATSKKYPAYVGKSIQEIADEEKKDPVDVALEIVAHDSPDVINHGMSEDDVRWAMALPWVATASDGSARAPKAGEQVHPRNFGTFARKIGRYAVQDGVIPLPLAIRSATGLPADIFGITDRGYLRPGCYADIVVFDPATYRDCATFEKPHEYATGVRYVFLAGKAAVDDGHASSQLFGRALRHQ